MGVLALWKICVVGLDEYVHDACGKILLACANFVLWQNFVGMCMDIFVGMDNFCGYEILTYGKILLGMWCWFLENLYGPSFGYMRTYLCMSL